MLTNFYQTTVKLAWSDQLFDFQPSTDADYLILALAGICPADARATPGIDFRPLERRLQRRVLNPPAISRMARNLWQTLRRPAHAVIHLAHPRAVAEMGQTPPVPVASATGQPERIEQWQP